VSEIEKRINVANATDEELESLKAMTEENLLRSAQSIDMFAMVESNRRLRVALHTEEHAIRVLTRWLVALTVVLVVLTLALVILGVRYSPI
jgi:hypothetical protein